MTFKMRILYWLALTFICLGSLRAQYNISVDSDCVNQNSILISRLLINELGEEKVKDYLENNIRFVVFFTIDSTGREEFYKARVFPDSLTNIISSELRKIKIERNYFYICYARLPNHSKNHL